MNKELNGRAGEALAYKRMPATKQRSNHHNYVIQANSLGGETNG